MDDKQLERELNSIRQLLTGTAWTSEALVELLIRKKIIGEKELAEVICEKINEAKRIQQDIEKQS